MSVRRLSMHSLVMTRIDFHSGVGNRIQYACRLVRKAYAAGSRIVILAGEQELDVLDEALWTFSEPDFLPHVRAGDPLAARTPIILATNDASDLPHDNVLINLSGEVPPHFASFERMIEIISTEDADRLSGRERYRLYQQRGYPLTHFTVDNP